jgi:hypothetical protein
MTMRAKILALGLLSAMSWHAEAATTPARPAPLPGWDRLPSQSNSSLQATAASKPSANLQSSDAPANNSGSALGNRLGASRTISLVQRFNSGQIVAGTRLGGGADSPSPEAISIDPRDIFELRQRSYTSGH